jgi:hypothetical protein
MIAYGASGRKAKRTKKEGEEVVLHFSLLKKMKKIGYTFSMRLSKNIIRPPLTLDVRAKIILEYTSVRLTKNIRLFNFLFFL